MSQFKSGDKVVAISCDNRYLYKPGAVLTVQVSDGGMISLAEVGSPCKRRPMFFEWRFALATPTPVTEPAQHKTNDAPTSAAAAVSIKPKKASIKDVILELLDTYKTGLTGQEIAEYSGIRLNSVTPRFAQLSRWTGSPYQKEAPKIEDTGRTRSGQIVWVLYGIGRGPDGT